MILTTGSALAAGPRLAGTRHLPIRWLLEDGEQLLVQTDAGNLSSTVNEAQARQWLQDAMSLWESGQYIPLPNVDPSVVFSATGQILSSTGLVRAATGISFAGPVALATDITSVTQYIVLQNMNLPRGNIVQVILDQVGDLIDVLGGVNARRSTLGLSVNYIFPPEIPLHGDKTGQIVLSEILLNGGLLDTAPSLVEIFSSVPVHELGHSLGLDHAQFYSHFSRDGFSANNSYLPLMFPVETGEDRQLGGPRFDDRASLALLYPNDDYFTQLGQIEGKVVLGATIPVFGANVVARRKDDTPGNERIDELEYVTSCVSDFLVTGDGSFFFGALPPGDYEIWLEPVLFGFRDVAGVGPYSETSGDASFSLRALREYWTLPESDDPNVDNRSTWTSVSVAAGERIELVSPLMIARDVESSSEEETQILGDHLVHFGGIGPAPSFTDRSQYIFHVSPADLVVIISVTPEASSALEVSDLNLYVRRDQRVTQREFDFKSANPTGIEQVVIAQDADPPLLPGVYFMGVENVQGDAAGFQIRVDRSVATPTPTVPPTPTPTPPLIVERAYLAGINQDPQADNLGRFGEPGTPPSLAEGNLVGSPLATTFIMPGGASDTGYFLPAFDEEAAGSLINANLEPSDTLMIAAEVSHVATGIVSRILNATPDEPEYLEALADVSQWIAADFRAESATAGILSLNATGEISNRMAITGVPPTSATGVVVSSSPVIHATDALLLLWDGRRTARPLQIAQKTATTLDLIVAATLAVNATGQDLSRPASPIGIDAHGPEIWSTTRTPPISVPVIRRPWPGGAPDRHLFIYETPEGIANELIAGDVVLVSGFIRVRESLDGEEQPIGDLIGLDDISVDFSVFGGQASPGSSTGQPLLGEAFIKTITGGVIVPVIPPVAGVNQYLATGAVSSVTTFLSTGDYSVVSLVLAATDDVTPPTRATISLRVDTTPLVISSVELHSQPDRTVQTQEGFSWISLFQDDELSVSAGILLNGDPPEAPIVTADLSTIDPELTHTTPATIESTTEALTILFRAKVRPESVPNDAASFVITATDDAGNVTTFDSTDIKTVVSVDPRPYAEPTPTFYDQYTPTPTPTATPTPHLSLPAGEVIVAASNADALDDNGGYPEGLVSRVEGNLVGTDLARLFAIPVLDGTAVRSRPLYDPQVAGSLLDGNIEVGDTLMVAAPVSRVTPELVAAVANAVPGSTEHAQAMAAVLPLAFARMVVPTEQLLVASATGDIFPTDATGVIGPAGREPDSLLFVWDGFRTEPPLRIASATTFDPQSVLTVHLSEDPSRYETVGSRIGVDLDGPRLRTMPDSPASATLAVQRNGVPHDLAGELAQSFELRQGDEVLLTAAVDVLGDLDGESTVYGDRIWVDDIRVDFSALGGPERLEPGSMALIGTDDVSTAEGSAAISGILTARGSVGSVTDVITAGPYEIAGIVLSITADVTDPYVETFPLRLDTSPPAIVGADVFSWTALRAGSKWYIARADEVLVVTGTVQLNGDPLDAVTTTLEIPQADTDERLLEPFAWQPHATLDDVAEAAFRITVGPQAITTEAAGLILRATDDAGNLAIEDLNRFGVVIGIQNGPTPTPTNTQPPTPTPTPTLAPTPTHTPTRYHQYTPTPTPTETPEPRPPVRFAASDIIVAASNVDAIDDNLGRFGEPGTGEARSVGNLVGTPQASLFAFPPGNATQGFVSFIFDPSVNGSLIDQNIEPGDVLLVAGKVTGVNSSLVETIRSNEPGSPAYQEAFDNRLRDEVYLRFIGDPAYVDNLSLTSTTQVYPTSATGLPAGSPGENISLILHWNGFETDPPLVIGPSAISSATAVPIFSVEAAAAPVGMSANLNPVGFDSDGPAISSTADGAPDVAVVSVLRTDPLTGQWNDLVLSLDTQFIPGDQILIAARLESNADLDGQTEENADRLSLDDVNVDAADIGDSAVAGDDAFVEETAGGHRRLPDLLVAEAVYLATVVVESVTEVETVGDYREGTLLFSARDDVRPAVTASLPVRVDTAGPIVTDITFPAASAEPGQPLTAGDRLAVTATANLRGDPVDSITAADIRADVSAFDPDLGSTAAMRLQVLDPAPPVVEAYFEAGVSPAAITNPSASVVILAYDDAGNLDWLDSSDRGLSVPIDNGPTPMPTPTSTPTPTPTSTPTPIPFISAGDAVLAASNIDAVLDRFAQAGLAGSTTALLEGDLVGSPQAGLFVDPRTKAPLFDPQVPGSLIMANLEPGDVLLLAATVSLVDPSIVEALATSELDSSTYREAAAAAASLAYATFDVVGSGLAIDGVTPGQRFHPTAALPVAGSASDLVLQWIGFETDPVLLVSSNSAAMATAEKVAQVFTVARPEVAVDANPISIDNAGPVFASADGDSRTADILSVERILWPDRPPVRLRLYPDQSGNGYLNELIVGDIVSISAALAVREDLDGECQEDGDALLASDVELNARAIEGGPREGGPVERGFFRIERGWLVPIEAPAVGEAQFFATAIVGGVTDISTQGDFTKLDLFLTAADDVGHSDKAVVAVRVDTQPPIVEDLRLATSSDRKITVDGLERPLLSVGDYLVASATIGLNGDPADALWAVMQASALQPSEPEIRNPLPPVPVDEERVRIDIGATVSAAAANTLDATVGLLVGDDAGNTVFADSADYGFIFAIETVPTITPTVTPTPTRTPTPVPSPGDLNGDGEVNREDLFLFARSWLTDVELPGTGPDLVADPSQRIDEADLRRLWELFRNLSAQSATPSPTAAAPQPPRTPTPTFTPSPTPGPPTPTPAPPSAG